MTKATHNAGSGIHTSHELDYDPRHDVDKLRPYAITRCGKYLRLSRIVDEYGKPCRTCSRLTAVDGQQELL